MSVEDFWPSPQYAFGFIAGTAITFAWAMWLFKATRPELLGDGWQPIESAPEDGTWILGLVDESQWEPGRLFWKKYRPIPMRWVAPVGHSGLHCWAPAHIRDDDLSGLNHGAEDPIAWMPLPMPDQALILTVPATA